MRQWSDRDRVSGLIIRLQNFKKPSDIFSRQIERKRSKEYLVKKKKKKKATKIVILSEVFFIVLRKGHFMIHIQRRFIPHF